MSSSSGMTITNVGENEKKQIDKEDKEEIEEQQQQQQQQDKEAEVEVVVAEEEEEEEEEGITRTTISTTPKKKKPGQQGGTRQVGVMSRKNSRNRIAPKQEVSTDIDWKTMGFGVFNFPHDDMYLRTVVIPIKTFIPDYLIKSESSIPFMYIREWVKLITSQHKMIEYKYEYFGNKVRPTMTLPLNQEGNRNEKVNNNNNNNSNNNNNNNGNNKGIKYEKLHDASTKSEVEDEKEEYEDILGTPNDIKLYLPNNNYDNKILRTYRQDIYQAYPVNEKELNAVILKKPDTIVDKLPECNILLESFKMESSTVVEPFLITMSIHSVQTNSKITESFSVLYDISTKQTITIENNKVKPVFPISTTNLHNLYIIIYAHRLAKNINEKDYKNYIKGAPPSKVETFKVDNNELNKEDLPWTPFLWSAVPLFDSEGKFLGSVKNPVSKENVKHTKEDDLLSNLPTRSFYVDFKLIKPSESVSFDEIYQCIAKENEMKKHKPFAGKMFLELKKLPSEFTLKHYDTSLNIIKPIDSFVTINDTSLPLYQQMQEFNGIIDQDSEPQLTFVNNLYIYLKSIVIKNTDALQIKIQFKRNDKEKENKEKENEKLFYSKCKRNMTDVVWSSIYYSKNPECTDEIKMKIPIDITNECHLLLSYYDVSTRKGNKVYMLLGHSIINLYDLNNNEKGIIRDGIHTSFISSAKSTNEFAEVGYLKTTKWSKNKKLQFETKLQSSIFSQDSSVHKYLVNYQNTNEIVGTINELISKVDSIAKKEILRFLPVILNTLFQLLCYKEDKIAMTAFAAIIAILKTFDNINTQRWLHFYVTYLFRVKGDKYVFDQLSRFCVECDERILEGFKSYWFLFSIMTKSMALLLDEHEKLKSKKKYDLFSNTFKNNLYQLLPRLLEIATESTLGYDVAVSFPLFLVSLFPMLPPSLVFKMIFSFITNANHYETTKIVKFTLLNIIANFQHYIPLNFPLEIEVESIDIYNTDIMHLFWSRHFLSGLILNEINESIQGNATYRDQGITMLRNLLRKHEVDNRYQHNEVRKQLVGIYFPYILICSQNYGSIKDMNDDEKIKWVQCFLYILKNIRPSILKWWWSQSTQSQIENFLEMCNLSLKYYLDKNESVESNFIILDVIHLFVLHFTEMLEKEEHPWQSKIMNIIIQLMNSQSELFISCFYVALAQFLFLLKKTLFTFKTSSYCQDLSEIILRHCNMTSRSVRERSSKIFFLLLKSNFMVRGNISRCSVQSILSVSRVVGTDMTQTFSLLHKTLSNVRKYYTAVYEDPLIENKDKFISKCEELLARLMDITKQNRRLAVNWIDEEMTADIYVSIANESAHSPDLRLTWLDSLALFHVQNGNIEEAAQCKIHISYLICQYVEHISPKQLPKELRGKSELFAKISPSVLNELPLLHQIKNKEAEENEGLFTSDLWNLSGVVRTLNEVVTLLDRSRRNELCLEVLHLLAAIYKRDRSYASLKVWAQRYAQVCDNLVNVTKEGKEVFSRYYRVTFYGKKWLEENHKKVYIYKKKFKYSIGDIAQSLMRTFAHKFNLPKEDIINLGNKEVDESSLDPNKIYFQIVSVQPYLSDVEERITAFEQNFNLNLFISEIPFNKDGGKIDEDDPSKLMKRKTIFKLKQSFPYITNRIETESHEEIVLTPIECAIESLQQRVNQFRTEVFCASVRKNNLQALLTGTLATTVCLIICL